MRTAGGGIGPARVLLRRGAMLPTVGMVIGPLRVVVSLHALALVVATAAGILVALRRARAPDVVLILAPVAVAAGVLGSQGLYGALHAGPGMASMGGLAAGLAVVAVAGRITRLTACELLDALAPAALLGFAIGRVGCFLAGCCFGRPTELGWGVVFPDLGPPARHPVQLYAAAADLALFLLLGPTTGRPGTTAGRALVGFGVVRFALETLRDPAATDVLGWHGLTVAQVCSVGLVTLGLLARRR